MIDISCRRCAAKYHVKDAMAGKWARCTKCNCRIDVPCRGVPLAEIDDAPSSIATTGQVRTDPIELRVSAVKLQWPNRCACCLDPADSTKVAAAARRRGSEQSADVRTWAVPYCSRCAKHSDLAEEADADYARCSQFAAQAAVVPLLIGVAGLVLAIVTNNPWLLCVLGLGFLIGIGVGLLVLRFGSRVQQQKLDAAKNHMRTQCAALYSAVRYEGWHGSIHTFSFDNEEYAEAFFQANASKMVR